MTLTGLSLAGGARPPPLLQTGDHENASGGGAAGQPSAPGAGRRPARYRQRVGRGTQRLWRSKPGVEPVSSRTSPGGQLPSSTRTTRPVARLPGGGAWVSTSCCMQAETRMQEIQSAKRPIFMSLQVALCGFFSNIIRSRASASHRARTRRAGTVRRSHRPRAHTVERPSGAGGVQG